MKRTAMENASLYPKPHLSGLKHLVDIPNMPSKILSIIEIYKITQTIKIRPL